MKARFQVTKGIECLFGTKDENIKLLERGLNVSTHFFDDHLEVEGSEEDIHRVGGIVEEYVSLVNDGYLLTSGDMNSHLRVLRDDPHATLRGLVEGGRSRNFGKKHLVPKTPNQRRYMEAIEKSDLVFGVGPAGTGKTYLAVAMGVSALLTKAVSRIILTRPAVEAGERLGFLPGTLQQKIDPYLRPLYDALREMLDDEKVERYLERGTIEVAPIAFMRGRTLNDSFIILDETQNSTAEQMKMVLTRLGFNSKMVVNGDLTQIDLPGPRRSGLHEALDVLRKVQAIRVVHFDERDVVRHGLVQEIVRAYDEYDERREGVQLELKLTPPPDEAASWMQVPSKTAGEPAGPPESPHV